MSDQSYELGKMSWDPDQLDSVRKSFRVPVEKAQKVWVIIHAKRYTVLDICFDGVRILIDTATEFQVDQSLENCELNIFDLSVKNLKGRVIHISRAENNELQCGIQWIGVSENETKEISDIVLKMKNDLLTDDDISFGSP